MGGMWSIRGDTRNAYKVLFRKPTSECTLCIMFLSCAMVVTLTTTTPHITHANLLAAILEVHGDSMILLLINVILKLWNGSLVKSSKTYM
jgi:hypothetical protein